MRKTLQLSLLLILGIAYATDIQVPRANDDDVVEVYYMAGIMAEFAKWKHLFNGLHVFHGAIGARNLNSTESATFEYFPPAFVQSTLPIVHNPGPECSIEFENTAIILAEPGINDTIWTAGEWLVTTISGKQYNKYLDWLPVYNETDNKYYLFTVKDKHEGELFIEQEDCFDFAVDSLFHLYDIGAKFDQSQEVKRVFAYLYAEEPTVVEDFEKERAEICRFYDTFQYKNESIITEVEEVCLFFPHPKYIYAWGQYYHWKPNFPFIGLHFEPFDLPGPGVKRRR